MSSNKIINKSNKTVVLFSCLSIIIIVVALFVVFMVNGEKENGQKEVEAASLTDLVIPKDEITQTAKFYPIRAGSVNMEILAVKASDGSIRTAFNTCQVCNGSPRAYYEQQGDVLVCQNCGNRFSTDMIEQQRGGCNPVPIMKDEKIDDGANIIIPKELIEKNTVLFTSNWKTR